MKFEPFRAQVSKRLAANRPFDTLVYPALSLACPEPVDGSGRTEIVKTSKGRTNRSHPIYQRLLIMRDPNSPQAQAFFEAEGSVSPVQKRALSGRDSFTPTARQEGQLRVMSCQSLRPMGLRPASNAWTRQRTALPRVRCARTPVSP